MDTDPYPMKRIHGYTVIAILFFGILVTGCVEDTSSNYVVPSQTTIDIHKTPTVKATTRVTTAVEEDFELVESHVEEGDYGTRYVVGTIKSNVDKQYSYVQVTINEYDSSGAQIGSTLANVNNLEPYGTWKFKAIVLHEDATDFKVMKVTAF